MFTLLPAARASCPRRGDCGQDARALGVAPYPTCERIPPDRAASSRALPSGAERTSEPARSVPHCNTRARLWSPLSPAGERPGARTLQGVLKPHPPHPLTDPVHPYSPSREDGYRGIQFSHPPTAAGATRRPGGQERRESRVPEWYEGAPLPTVERQKNRLIVPDGPGGRQLRVERGAVPELEPGLPLAVIPIGIEQAASARPAHCNATAAICNPKPAI